MMNADCSARNIQRLTVRPDPPYTGNLSLAQTNGKGDRIGIFRLRHFLAAAAFAAHLMRTC